jgi:hypothetical protein
MSIKILCCFFISAILLSSPTHGAEEWGQPWNDLRTTFVPGLDASIGGDLGGLRLPLTTEVPPDVDCTAQFGNSVYNGYRVPQHFGNDTYTSIYTLYDRNGVIAGIQVMFPVSETLLPNNTFLYDQVPMFRSATVDDVDYYLFTAYFVDPTTICTVGRERPKEGEILETGDRLVFQNGPWVTEELLLKAPKNRTEAIEYGYGENKCLPGMGNHTFYGMFPTTDCDTIVPVFLLQNKAGYLTGFGFDWVAQSTSARFEHPPGYVLDIIVGPSKPECLLEKVETVGVTTTHIYFTNTNPEC